MSGVAGALLQVAGFKALGVPFVVPVNDNDTGTRGVVLVEPVGDERFDLADRLGWELSHAEDCPPSAL